MITIETSDHIAVGRNVRDIRMKHGMHREVTPAEVEGWICERIAEFVHLSAGSVNPEANFEAFGIDSARAISLMAELDEWLALPGELPLELLFEAESIRQGAESIARAANEMVGAAPTSGNDA